MESSKLTPLCRIAYKYGTDKCPQILHSYTPVYYQMFERRKNTVKKVLEMGIGEGASLKMWRDFFSNAMIYGADIEPGTMFEDKRIKTYLADEREKEDIENLVSQTGPDIDIFVDDASHYWGHQAYLAKIILPLLQKEVVYIIEDVGHPRHILNELKDYDYIYPALPLKIEKPKNKLIIIKNK